MGRTAQVERGGGTTAWQGRGGVLGAAPGVTGITIRAVLAAGAEQVSITGTVWLDVDWHTGFTAPVTASATLDRARRGHR